MAWIASSTAQLIMFFKDDDGAISRHTIHLPMDVLDLAVEVAKQYGQLVQCVSNCALWKMHIVFSSWSDGPIRGALGSSVKIQSVLLFLTSAGRYVFPIPGMAAAKLLTPPDPYAGIQFDAADPDILALATAMTDGIGGTRPVAPWNGGGMDGSGGGTWGGGGGGGSWGGGGGGGSWGDDGWSNGGGGGGGTWGDGPGGEFTWTGVYLVRLIVAYRGYDGTRYKR